VVEEFVVAQLLLMFCNVHAFRDLDDSFAPCPLVLVNSICNGSLYLPWHPPAVRHVAYWSVATAHVCC
jgi:hypothetical protein